MLAIFVEHAEKQLRDLVDECGMVPKPRTGIHHASDPHTSLDAIKRAEMRLGLSKNRKRTPLAASFAIDISIPPPTTPSIAEPSSRKPMVGQIQTDAQRGNATFELRSGGSWLCQRNP
jgi:hypothetical protein